MNVITTMKQFASAKLLDILTSRYIRDDSKIAAVRIFQNIFEKYVSEDEAAAMFAELADTDRELERALDQVRNYSTG